ncbi:MAG: hypothetical protein H0T48_07710 [Gemmatimonadaceae bacterium]|nr:hypothetical protein [Gemmatimonadaceae bacterium]
MMGSHITLRLSLKLATVLARRARQLALPKSQLVRDAVNRYLSQGAVPPDSTRSLTAAELAERWKGMPRLTPKEASDLEADLAASHRRLPPAPTPWE